MAGDYLLDTNVVIAYFNGEKSVIDKIIAAREIVIPVAVLGELHYGAAASRRPQENRSRIRGLMEWARVVVCDDVTALIYGRFKAALRSKGRQIPDNDIWIAASARQFDIPLVSRDRHYETLDEIDWQVW